MPAYHLGGEGAGVGGGGALALKGNMFIRIQCAF